MRFEDDVVYFDNLARPESGIIEDNTEVRVRKTAYFHADNAPGDFCDIGSIEHAASLGKTAAKYLKELFPI